MDGNSGRNYNKSTLKRGEVKHHSQNKGKTHKGGQNVGGNDVSHVVGVVASTVTSYDVGTPIFLQIGEFAWWVQCGTMKKP